MLTANRRRHRASELTSCQPRKGPIDVQVLSDLLPQTLKCPAIRVSQASAWIPPFLLAASKQTSLRHTAGEVDACQVLRRGDGVPEHRAVCWEELDDVWGQTTLSQDSVHSVAGGHCTVTGLPQNHVPLQDKADPKDPQLIQDHIMSAPSPAQTNKCLTVKHSALLTDTLTIRAGVPARFPPMAVKLKGATAATKP